MGINDADGFDMQKIFHENKPNRTSDNTKNQLSPATVGVVDLVHTTQDPMDIIIINLHS